MKCRKGYIFSIDVFIAVAVIAIGLVLMFLSASFKPYTLEISSTAEDMMSFLSTTKVYNLNDDYYPFLKELKQGGNITNLDNTLLQQIGELYERKVWDEGQHYFLHSQLTEALTMGMVEHPYSFGLWINDESVYNMTDFNEDSDVIISSKSIVFGMINGTYFWGPYTAEVWLWQV